MKNKLASLFFVSSLTLSFHHLKAESPLSAIDWLSNTISNPPHFLTEPQSRSNIRNSFTGISEEPLPRVSRNTVGVYAGQRFGFPHDLWSGDDETELASLIDQLPVIRIFQLQSFTKKLLISELPPPTSTPGVEESGGIFLKKRIEKLVKVGALDEAETLINLSLPNILGLVNVWEDVSLLTNRPDNLCNTILNSFGLDVTPAVKVICLARSGDWNAAAILLTSAATLGQIDVELETLLIKYLDPEVDISVKSESLKSTRSPLYFFLKRSSGVQSQTETAPISFLYSDLNRNVALRKRVYAAERLAAKAVINSNTLFSIYRTSTPSASGGIWKRMRHVQELDRLLNQESPELEVIKNKLVDSIREFNSINLLSHLSYAYSIELSNKLSGLDSTILNDPLLTLFLLSKEVPDVWLDLHTDSSFLKLAVLIKKNYRAERPMKFSEDFPLSISLSRDDAILKSISTGVAGIFPVNRNTTLEINSDIKTQRKGSAILKAINLLAHGLDADLLDIEAGLASLVKLGFQEQAVEIAIELLVKKFVSDFLD